MALNHHRKRFPRVAAFRERYSAGDTAKNFQGGRYNKMKYEYPAVISYDHQDRVYYVNFPDISNCFTDGLTLREALDNAEDVLNLMLSNAEAKHESLPDPSEINSICLNAGEIVSMIQADTDLYSKIAV